jgi:hypothetical protein
MKARIYWLCATAAGRLLARSVAWLAGFAGASLYRQNFPLSALSSFFLSSI